MTSQLTYTKRITFAFGTSILIGKVKQQESKIPFDVQAVHTTFMLII